MSWRVRTWVLALAPLGFAMAAPWILLAAFSGRLPDLAYVYGWSRTGPEFAHLAPTWSEWAADHLFFAIAVVFVVPGLLTSRRWPRLRRWLVVSVWLCSGQVIAHAVAGVLTVLDVTGYPAAPTPRWVDAVNIAVALAAGAVAWILVGRLPSPPDAGGEVPAGVPLRQLGPAERAMFFETTRSVKAIAAGGVLVALSVALSVAQSQSLTLLLVGVAMVLLSKAHLRVDGDGVVLDLPLLRVRRRVSYREISYAEVSGERFSWGWWPLLDNSRRSGYVGQGGQKLVLRLGDGQLFVVSLRDPAAAAALINGGLARGGVKC